MMADEGLVIDFPPARNRPEYEVGHHFGSGADGWSRSSSPETRPQLISYGTAVVFSDARAFFQRSVSVSPFGKAVPRATYH